MQKKTSQHTNRQLKPNQIDHKTRKNWKISDRNRATTAQSHVSKLGAYLRLADESHL